LHRKRVHCSGGELELGCSLGGLALAPLGGFEFMAGAFGGAVAVADVFGERVAEGVPVEVLGVLQTNSSIAPKVLSIRLR